MITKGDRLKLDFEVEAVVDGVAKKCVFKDLLSKKTLVSVYMRNNTGSCDKQVAALVKEAKALENAGVTLIGVSRDKVGSHVKYAAKVGATFPLVSDPEDLFSKAADAVVEKSMYGKKYLGPARAAYLLDAKGVVLDVIPKVESANHGAEARACAGL